MPQHLVRRPPCRIWPALAAIAALLAPVGYVPARAAAPGAAALAELARHYPLDSRSVHIAPFGGSGAWQTGTLAIPAGHAGARADEPRVFLYVARREGPGWTAAIEGTRAFSGLAVDARRALVGTPSADLLATTATTATTGTTTPTGATTPTAATISRDGSALLSLPWAAGTTWRLTGGPHHFKGGRSRPWSSLDFAGPKPGVSALVRSARGGIAVRPCANMVQVRHAHGWTTSYYHLRYIRVRSGQSIGRGAALGYTSTRAGCGGSATGPHVHFSLLRHGSYVNIRGHTIGGWTVEEGSSPYQGCMVRGTTRRCAPNGEIPNYGAIGTQPAAKQTKEYRPQFAGRPMPAPSTAAGRSMPAERLMAAGLVACLRLGT